MIAATVIGPVAFPTQYMQPAPTAAAAEDVPESVPGSDAPNNAGIDGRNRGAEAAAAGKVSEGDDASRAEGETLGENAAQNAAQELTAQELKQLEQLKQTDREVRQHELAHQIAGGQYTGGASYEYQIGPDGQRYAVAGEVSIDYGPVPGDPDATIDKMQTVIAAALAPMDPSPKDYQVAARARQYMAEARMERATQQLEARMSTDDAASGSTGEARTPSPQPDPSRMYRDVAADATQAANLATA